MEITLVCLQIKVKFIWFGCSDILGVCSVWKRLPTDPLPAVLGWETGTVKLPFSCLMEMYLLYSSKTLMILCWTHKCKKIPYTYAVFCTAAFSVSSTTCGSLQSSNSVLDNYIYDRKEKVIIFFTVNHVSSYKYPQRFDPVWIQYFKK